MELDEHGDAEFFAGTRQCPQGSRARREVKSSFFIKEVDRFNLELPGKKDLRPYGMSLSRDGFIYISLFGAGIVAKFDWRRRSFEIPASLRSFAGPLGIDFDAQGKLWIVDSLRNQIAVWNPVDGELFNLEKISAETERFASPVGICRGHDGSMLVADTGNHRLIRISDDRFCQVFKSGEGVAQGEFRLPNSLCVSSKGDGYWILDHRNHRVQHLDSEGHFRRQIGKCGLGRGELCVPESVVQFNDGIMVVSQGHLNKSLRLFSPSGDQVGYLEIDYAPGGMLIFEGKLLVAQFSGASIRVYERR